MQRQRERLLGQAAKRVPQARGIADLATLAAVAALVAPELPKRKPEVWGRHTGIWPAIQPLLIPALIDSLLSRAAFFERFGG
jgi:hypothetical protein